MFYVHGWPRWISGGAADGVVGGDSGSGDGGTAGGYDGGCYDGGCCGGGVGGAAAGVDVYVVGPGGCYIHRSVLSLALW